MEKISIKGKTFRLYIDNARIQKSVAECARKLNEHFKNCSQPPLIVGVLNGSVYFISDLSRELDFVCEVDFVKVSSYQGLSASENVCDVIGLKHSICGKDVLIVDDIVDSGHTMKHLVELFSAMKPRSLATAAFIFKPQSLVVDVNVDFCAIEMKDQPFIVGYGLDYDEFGRNLKDIYILSND